jgi:hypothetical protein
MATLHDAHVVTLNDNNAVPGSTFRQKLIITNDGTVNEPDILLNYSPDAQLPVMTTSPISLINSGGMWYNPPSSISKAPGEGIVLTNFFSIPPNIPLGTLLQMTGNVAYEPPITNWVEDYTPWNNVINHQTYIVSSGSKDALSANGTEGAITKQVFPSGTGPEGAITRSDSVLDYVIHFQNTGYTRHRP